MATKTVLVYDANTSSLNAKLDRSARKAKGVGKSFEQGGQAVDGLVTKLGSVVAVSASIERIWAGITRNIERQQTLAAKRKGSLDSLAAMTNVFSTPGKAKQGRSLGIDIQKKLGLETEGEAFDIVNKLASRFGEDATLSGALTDEFVEAGKVTGQRANLVQVIESVADALDAIGEGAEGVSGMIGLIGVSAQTSKADFDAFAKALGELGVQAKLTGTSTLDVASLLSQLGGESIDRLRTKFNALLGVMVNMGNIEDIRAKGGLIPFLEGVQNLPILEQKAALGVENKEAFVGMQLLIEILDAAKKARPALEAGKATFIAESGARFVAAGGQVGTRLNQAAVARQLTTEGLIGGDMGANRTAIAENLRSLSRIQAASGDLVPAMSDFLGINDSSLINIIVNRQTRNMSAATLDAFAQAMSDQVQKRMDDGISINPNTISDEGR